MIRHIVMFKLKESFSVEDKSAHIKTAFELTNNFKKDIPALINFELVTNSHLAPAGNYEIALICDFESIKGLDEYQIHPVHKKFGAFITEVREGRACIDYEF